MESYADTLDSLMRAIVSGETNGAQVQLRGNADFTASDRLNVYAQAYRLRLRDALARTFPASVFALGEVRFFGLADGFTAAHPPLHFNIDHYTPGFAAYVAGHDDDRFAADLAALEGAIHSVYHAPETPALNAEWAEAQSPDSLVEVSLRPRAASQLLALAYPAETYLAAFRAGETPARPQPHKHWLLVLRHRHQVKRLPLEEAEHALLALLEEGRTLGSALADARMAEYVNNPGFAPSLQSWFARWVSEGAIRQPE